mmetsp:Transcript_9306/g.26579  ORF Transcript_9306/g.26579 Transcript_9306/m.26579 type:complete len:524 (-) Transcript_9306:33-1604(-)
MIGTTITSSKVSANEPQSMFLTQSFNSSGRGTGNSSIGRNDSTGNSSRTLGANQNKKDATNSRAPTAPSSADALLVKELNALSIHERQQVYEDIHGISSVIEETPELIEKSVHAMQVELKRTRGNIRAAYDKAIFLCPTKFMSNEFLLQFLRCEGFDRPKKAAARCLNYFDFKLEMFGYEKLCKTITLDDLDEDDRIFLSTGALQMLGTDRSGRPIIVSFPRKRRIFKSFVNIGRAYWYIHQVALEYPDASKLGAVVIMYDAGIQSDCATPDEQFRQYYHMNYLKGGSKYFSSIPIQLAGFHFCHNNPRLVVPMTTIQFIIGTHGRVRFRVHNGSHTECMYILMTFGISMRNFPVDESGFVTLDDFHKWILQRQAIEHSKYHNEHIANITNDGSNEKISEMMLYPKANDILLGRGKPFQIHPGNLFLSDFVDKYYSRYQTCRKYEKTTLTIQIVAMVKQSGSRFVKKDGKFWVCVDDDRAREKVSHTFRNLTILKNNSSNNKSNGKEDGGGSSDGSNNNSSNK